MKKEDN